MDGSSETRTHEVTFCANVQSWAEALFVQHPEWPFTHVEIEKRAGRTRKRSDIQVFQRQYQTPVLCGEVKMPGTSEGRSPYDPALMRDAADKAQRTGARYFFTWNVNKLVLFDRSLWEKPVHEQRIREWELGVVLTQPVHCDRPEVQARIRDQFLPEFFAAFAKIATGEVLDWGMPPDEVFIRSFRSHVDWPVEATRDFLAGQCATDRAFADRFQQWLTEEMQWSFNPADPENWAQTVERAAKTLCYVFSNRAIFYDAIRARYPDVLPKLVMPSETADWKKTYDFFRQRFARAVKETGDYEPILYPDVHDWAGALVFASPSAPQAWKGVLANLDRYNFRHIPHDVIGGIFKRLIAPEERQRFGQFFTHEDIVDVINAFCIRRAGDVVLDPACGSGSFLVRAYHRKAWLSEQPGGGRRTEDANKSHQALLREIYGCDIALFPAHLATLNLASRRIEDEENYPLVRRGNFFEVIERPEQFCSVPVREAGKATHKVPVPLGALDAIIGNPPYVRQELIPRRASVKRMSGETAESFAARRKNTKEHLQQLVAAAWPDLKLTGRSDLHCYFWPVAAKHLKEGGFFGFLTSSSWLDVEYGFALQGWILRHFKLIAILESVEEPWFEDARVKTCATILQRCSDEEARNENLVKFVRLASPLAGILGERPKGDEAARQKGATNLRILIESTDRTVPGAPIRIISVPQGDLWWEGVEAGRVLAGAPAEPNGNGEEENGRAAPSAEPEARVELIAGAGEYAAGKWGRFLRAPRMYFRFMFQYGHRFARLGEIADIRFGIKSGCDAFFMPRDVTDEVIAQVREGLPWNNVGLMSQCTLKEIESGRVRIVRAGDHTLHPIEAEYLRPEVHSLMAVDRPVIRPEAVDRVVLWVDKPLKELGRTHVARYIRWGAKQKFAFGKSTAVPVPQRSTCASRPRWYDLTGVETGVVLWPMAQQYRHIAPVNPCRLVCNHNLFFLNPRGLSEVEGDILPAVLNSTFVGLFKTYYGRYAGTEGNLKTEVVDVKVMQVPNPVGVSDRVAKRMLAAFRRMQERRVGHLVDESWMDCHSMEHARVLMHRPLALSAELRQADRRALDGAVLELIGVSDPTTRKVMLDELYVATATHYRQIRLVEIQKQIQRLGGNNHRLTAGELAAGIWDSLAPEEQGPPLLDWLAQLPGPRRAVQIPDGKPKPLGPGHMFAPGGVDFIDGKAVHHETYGGPEQAALVVTLAELDIRGEVHLPPDEPACREWGRLIARRLAAASARFDQLAGSRTGTQTLRDDTVAALLHWYVHGRRE